MSSPAAAKRLHPIGVRFCNAWKATPYQAAWRCCWRSSSPRPSSAHAGVGIGASLGGGAPVLRLNPRQTSFGGV